MRVLVNIDCLLSQGASVLGQVKADLYLTGEMSHHEVLAANAQNTR